SRGIGPSDSIDHAAGDFSNARVQVVRDIDTSGGVHRHARRIVEGGVGGGPPVPGKVRGSVACDGGDGAVGYFANAVIAGVRDIQVAARIERHAGGEEER